MLTNLLEEKRKRTVKISKKYMLKAKTQWNIEKIPLSQTEVTSKVIYKLSSFAKLPNEVHYQTSKVFSEK